MNSYDPLSRSGVAKTLVFVVAAIFLSAIFLFDTLWNNESAAWIMASHSLIILFLLHLALLDTDSTQSTASVFVPTIKKVFTPVAASKTKSHASYNSIV